MDPFEDIASADRLKEAQRKVEYTYLTTQRNNKCIDAAKKICAEIQNVNSPLHHVIRKKIPPNGPCDILIKELPKDLHHYFDILKRCDEKVIEPELNKASKYLRIGNIHGCDGDENCFTVPGIHISYNNKSLK